MEINNFERFFLLQKSIENIKYMFTKILCSELGLFRTSSPKFLQTKTGIQDDLAGSCESVKFKPKNLDKELELVHSLAKWKREAIKRYNVPYGFGILTDMDAIRKDEELDKYHSIYVDQYDWEKEIKEYNFSTLKEYVNKIYKCIKEIKKHLNAILNLKYSLPEEIYFIDSEELLNLYPNKTAKEREYEITKIHRTVFLVGIGKKLSDNSVHDIRAIDYDNWTDNLNGDILFWDNVNNDVIELSSMGIRVNKESLVKQYEEIKGKKFEIENEYYKKIYNNELPLTIGGGIGESRLCMFLLEKRHIAEVQVSEWDENCITEFKKNGIEYL